MDSIKFAKGENKRRAKPAKRKKPSNVDGVNDLGGGGKSSMKFDGIKSDSDLLKEHWKTNQWPQNGHSDSNSGDMKPNNLDSLATPADGDAELGCVPPSSGGGQTASPTDDNGDQQVSSLTTATNNNGSCLPGGGPPNNSMGGPPLPRFTPQPGGMGGAVVDGQFMPQQSQVFVFSTSLANQAAEAVQRGLCRSIVDFHLDQPATKQFLQNCPMGPGPPPFPPRPGGGGMPPQYPCDPSGRDMVDNKMFLKEPPETGGSALANVELWVQQQNASLQEGPFSPSFGPPGKASRSSGGGGSQHRWIPSPTLGGPGLSSINDFMGPMDPSMMGGGGPPPGAGGSFMNDPLMGPQGGGGGNGPPGGRILDENLTPEQLQRREEQLAHLQKLKQMLFPDKRGGSGGMEFDSRGRPPPHMMFSGGPRGGPPPPDGMMGMMGGMPPRFPGPPGAHGMPSGMMNPDGMMMPAGGMDMGPGGFVGEPEMPPNWDGVSPEEREWFKLQHEYYLEQMHKQRQMQMEGGGQHMPQQHGGPGVFFGGDMPPRLPPGHMGPPRSPGSPPFGPGGPMVNDPGGGGMFFNGPPRMNFPPNGPPGPDFHPDFIPDGMYGPYGGPQGMMGPGGRMHPHDPMYGPPGNGLRFPGNCKPKRRRPLASGMVGTGISEKPDDIYRHLQPAPSPQQFCSLNLFEGQELTITRQLNLAYQEPGSGVGAVGAESSTARSTPTIASQPTTQRNKRKKHDASSADRSKLDPESLSGAGGGNGGSSKMFKSEQTLTPPDLFGNTSNSSSLNFPPTSKVGTPGGGSGMPGSAGSPSGGQRGDMSVPSPSGFSASERSLGMSGQFETLQPNLSTADNQTLSTTTAPGGSSLSSQRAGAGTVSNITSPTLAVLAQGVASLQAEMYEGGPFRNVQMAPPSGSDSKYSADSPRNSSSSRPGMTIKSENKSSRGEMNIGGDTTNNPMSEEELRIDSAAPSSRSQTPSFTGAIPSLADNKSPTDGGTNATNNTSLELAAKRTPPTATSSSNKIMTSPGGHVGNTNIQIEARTPNTIQYLPTASNQQQSDGLMDPNQMNVGPDGQLVQNGPIGGDSMMGGPDGRLMSPGGPMMDQPMIGGGPDGLFMGPGGEMMGPQGPMIGPNGEMIGPGGQMIQGEQMRQMMGPNGPMMGPNGPMIGPNGSMMGPNGPLMGPNGPMMGPNGPIMGPNGPMMGPNGPMMVPNGPMMGPNGQMMGPNGPMMGPNGPMMGPNGQMIDPEGFMLGPGYGGPMPGFDGPMHRYPGGPEFGGGQIGMRDFDGGLLPPDFDDRPDMPGPMQGFGGPPYGNRGPPPPGMRGYYGPMPPGRRGPMPGQFEMGGGYGPGGGPPPQHMMGPGGGGGGRMGHSDPSPVRATAPRVKAEPGTRKDKKKRSDSKKAAAHPPPAPPPAPASVSTTDSGFSERGDMRINPGDMMTDIKHRSPGSGGGGPTPSMMAHMDGGGMMPGGGGGPGGGGMMSAREREMMMAMGGDVGMRQQGGRRIGLHGGPPGDHPLMGMMRDEQQHMMMGGDMHPDDQRLLQMELQHREHNMMMKQGLGPGGVDQMRGLRGGGGPPLPDMMRMGGGMMDGDVMRMSPGMMGPGGGEFGGGGGRMDMVGPDGMVMQGGRMMRFIDDSGMSVSPGELRQMQMSGDGGPMNREMMMGAGTGPRPDMMGPGGPRPDGMRNEYAMMMLQQGDGGMKRGGMGSGGAPMGYPGGNGSGRPGSGLMMAMDADMLRRPESHPQRSGDMMMNMGGGGPDGGMRPGSAAMMGMANMHPGDSSGAAGGMRPGSAAMMGMQGDGRPMGGMGSEGGTLAGLVGGDNNGMRPGSAAMMHGGGGGQDGGQMRPGSAVMGGGGEQGGGGRRSNHEMPLNMMPGDVGMRPGSAAMMMMAAAAGVEGGMRPNSAAMMMGMDGPGGMRPGSGGMMGGPGGDVRQGGMIGGPQGDIRQGVGMMGGPGGDIRQGGGSMLGGPPGDMRQGGMMGGPQGDPGMMRHGNMMGGMQGEMRGMMGGPPSENEMRMMMMEGRGGGMMHPDMEMMMMSGGGGGGGMGEPGMRGMPRHGGGGGPPGMMMDPGFRGGEMMGGGGGRMMGISPNRMMGAGGGDPMMRGGPQRMDPNLRGMDSSSMQLRMRQQQQEQFMMHNGGMFSPDGPMMDMDRFGMPPGGGGNMLMQQDEQYNAAQFQQFQQQLYAKNHAAPQQSGPPQDIMMRGGPSGGGGGGSYELMRGSPNFGSMQGGGMSR